MRQIEYWEALSFTPSTIRTVGQEPTILVVMGKQQGLESLDLLKKWPFVL